MITLTFGGPVRLAEVNEGRRFRDIVRSFEGAPFRVLADFRASGSWEPGVPELFVRAQSFALKANLEKDAFVTSDADLRRAFNRIAHETRRFHWLGPLRFFEELAPAEAYVQS